MLPGRMKHGYLSYHVAVYVPEREFLNIQYGLHKTFLRDMLRDPVATLRTGWRDSPGAGGERLVAARKPASMSNESEQAGTAVPHVLVVEDHALVRQFLTMVIGNAGFRVTTADNGDVALALLEQGLEADMLLSDIRMPGSVDGLQLARWAKARRPNMAILLQTGFSEGPVEEFRVLQKPYPPEVLLASIQAELKRVRGL